MAALPGVSVLVVENDALLAMSIQDTLAGAGCERVEIEFSGQQVVEKIAKQRFDLATLSLTSPDGAGPETAKQLEKHNIPFVYISGYDKSLFPDLPQAPWLSKPFADTDLLSAVKVALDRASEAGRIQPGG